MRLSIRWCMVELMKHVKTAEVWVNLGLEVLASKGAAAVRVERLARTLGVTKGSFYWHFEDRRALERAMAAQWEALATEQIIVATEGGGGSAAERVKRLIERTMAHPSAPAMEQAVRAWGASDKTVQRVLARVDERRQAYVRGLLMEHGLPRTVAVARARLLYLVLIGEFAWVGHGGAPTSAAMREELWRLMVP